MNPSYPASRVNDGIIGTGGDYMSANNPAMPQYVTLVWSAGQSLAGQSEELVLSGSGADKLEY